MKRILLLSAVLTATCGFAQNAPIDFEPDGIGADWTWSTFEAPEGEENPTFTIEPNPSVDATNGSATVAKMDISYGTPDAWGKAGCESMHGADLGAFTVTPENSTVTLSFYQEGFAAPVALKFATTEGAAFFETIVDNTIADEWVTVEFDMSVWIGSTLPGILDQIIFFPSYAPRETGHVVYFDNVSFGPQGEGPQDPMTPAPDPIIPEAQVLSVYSDFYPNNTVGNFNLNAFQGGGAVSQIQIEGNNTGKILGLTFYGADWTDVNINEYDSVHFDYWARNSTGFSFFVINAANGIPGGNPAEPRYTISASGDEGIVSEEWVSVSVPLQFFLDFPTPGFTFTLDNVNQYKFEGNGDVYFDNIYFSKEGTVGIEELTAAGFKAYPNPTQDAWTIVSDNATISTVAVYNIVGQEVARFSPASKQVRVDATDFNSGLYFVHMETSAGAQIIKLIKE